MNINLPTGKTIFMSAYEYFFILKEEDVDAFFQSCIADDLGEEINNPFSNRASMEKIAVDDHEEDPEK